MWFTKQAATFDPTFVNLFSQRCSTVMQFLQLTFILVIPEFSVVKYMQTSYIFKYIQLQKKSYFLTNTGKLKNVKFKKKKRNFQHATFHVPIKAPVCYHSTQCTKTSESQSFHIISGLFVKDAQTFRGCVLLCVITKQ